MKVYGCQFERVSHEGLTPPHISLVGSLHSMSTEFAKMVVKNDVMFFDIWCSLKIVCGVGHPLSNASLTESGRRSQGTLL